MRSPIVLLVLLVVFGGASSLTGQEKNDGWRLETIPDAWKNLPGGHYASREGYSWFRCLVEVPEAWRGRSIELFIEGVDDARELFFNGDEIGTVGTFPPEYRSGLGAVLRFEVEATKVLFGQRNIVAVRIYQNESRGGFNVAAPVLFAGPEAIRLNGKWQGRPGDDAAWAKLAARQELPADAAFSKLESTAEILETLKKLDDDDGPIAPQVALGRFKIPEDLVLELAIGEPEVRQPLSMKWDERGRLWVMQYLQYPNPAGLKMVSRDKYLRAVYDRIPPPPPRHFRGADKITIHEDTDGDGQYDRHQTFVDGLSLATSFAFGRGGLFVLNPPYLLFYPDRDHDDVPDGDPEVLLEGFGLEDSHSIANSLRFGPDGWLYGCQGSTVSGNIRRPGSKDPVTQTMGQLVWRYHPETRRYEVFAEGGGNAFGLEIDSKGRIYSGHNGGDTRGFHYVQGGYYQKGFGKHGPLSNPHAFGYFAAMKHPTVPRFTHQFVIYEGGTLPAQYNGNLFGVAPLLSHVVRSGVEEDRSSFQTKDLGLALATDDKWFRPVDIQVGPDGALYVADMYEQRIDHASHYQGRIHAQSGRIYRLRAPEARPIAPRDLGTLASLELVELLASPNRWHRETAQRLLADRRDRSLAPMLRERLRGSSGQLALELSWALAAVGGLDAPTALANLDHVDPYVRLWTVRLLADERKVTDAIAARLVTLAAGELSVHARSQLAASARRLPARQGLPIVRQLMNQSADADDIHLPLLIWWAIESQADGDRELVLAMFEDRELWEQPLVKQHLTQRLMRRFAQSGQRKDLLACARLLALAPSAEHGKLLLAGFEEAYKGRSLTGLPDELVAAMAKTGGGSVALRLRQGDASAVDEALVVMANEKADKEQRLLYIRLFADVVQPRAVPVLLALVGAQTDASIRTAAVGALQAYGDSDVGGKLLELQASLPEETREVALTVLASRKAWATRLLSEVDAGRIKSDSIPTSVARRVLLLRDDAIAQAVRKHWGEIEGASTAEMLAEIERISKVLQAGSGVPHNGKKLFLQTCGKCHKLFDDGGAIGPDLTSYKRDDLRRMLDNVVNPSLEIREGFETYLVTTQDGRTLNGFIVDQDNQVVVLRTAEGQSIVVARDELDELAATKRSIMPEGILKPMTDQQLRDLFAYLRATQPVP